MPPINLRHRGRVSCCPVLPVAVLAHSMTTGCALGVASRILRRRGQLRSHQIADHLTHVPCVRIVLEDFDRIERSAESLWGEELKVGGRLPKSELEWGPRGLPSCMVDPDLSMQNHRNFWHVGHEPRGTVGCRVSRPATS